MLASCQTLTMLTGGIDLSVGTIATISAFVMATQVTLTGSVAAMMIALVPAVLWAWLTASESAFAGCIR